MFDNPLQNPALLVLLGTTCLFTIGALVVIYLDQRGRKRDLQDKAQSTMTGDQVNPSRSGVLDSPAQ